VCTDLRSDEDTILVYSLTAEVRCFCFVVAVNVIQCLGFVLRPNYILRKLTEFISHNDTLFKCLVVDA